MHYNYHKLINGNLYILIYWIFRTYSGNSFSGFLPYFKVWNAKSVSELLSWTCDTSHLQLCYNNQRTILLLSQTIAHLVFQLQLFLLIQTYAAFVTTLPLQSFSGIWHADKRRPWASLETFGAFASYAARRPYHIARCHVYVFAVK